IITTTSKNACYIENSDTNLNSNTLSYISNSITNNIPETRLINPDFQEENIQNDNNEDTGAIENGNL
ncbi:MAG: hypothetical protein P1U46_02700, partial [Patescibacteria group bacterium]|nr:hypothetical protein [Patescibacteria group bacterium]